MKHNKESYPKSKVTVNVGAHEISFKVSFAELFDEIVLKPLKKEVMVKK